MKMLWALLLLGSCASQTPKTPTVSAKVHLGDRWFPFRSAFLGMSKEDAIARDADLDEKAPPEDAFWDEQLAIEAASIWKLLCNDCHGGKRSVTRAAKMPPPPEGWGHGEATFFGKARPHAEIFRIIYHGAEAKTEDEDPMPAWGDRVSREQIWGLVWFIEQASNDVVLSQ